MVRRLCRISDQDFRTYQAHAAWAGLNNLSRGNLILNLPQSTGKTFVSQLLAYAYLREKPHAKVLVVVPTKELREQYDRMADWMGYLTPRLAVVNFRDSLANLRMPARVMVQQAHVIVTTPQLFEGRLGWISEGSLKAIRLCVLDEIDLWPIEDFEDEEGVRFHRSFVNLKSRLQGQGTRFLGLTASPLGDRGRKLLFEDLGCRELHPFHPSVVDWLPKVRIVPVACFDPFVVARDIDISDKSSELLGRLSREIGSEVLDAHQDDFWLFIKALASGLYGPNAASIALALLDNERERIQLFEDILPPFGRVKVKCAIRLAHGGRPAVVYCREIQLVERLAREDWASSPAVAHSRMGDEYLAEILKFKTGARHVLLMTRDLGKRGLDFPMARSLILCSPKSSWRTMDQELCRTRGQRRKIKRVYVLFYESTYEEEKMRRVLMELVRMRMYGKFRKFTLSRRWTRWLRMRPALTLPEYISTRAEGSADAQKKGAGRPVGSGRPLSQKG
jgi:superfamily II DNA or RNA helicase